MKYRRHFALQQRDWIWKRCFGFWWTARVCRFAQNLISFWKLKATEVWKEAGIPHCGPTNIKSRGRKFSRPGDLVPEIFHPWWRSYFAHSLQHWYNPKIAHLELILQFISKYSVIKKDGLNFVRLYVLNYTWYVNDLHIIWKRRS